MPRTRATESASQQLASSEVACVIKVLTLASVIAVAVAVAAAASPSQAATDADAVPHSQAAVACGIGCPSP